MALSYAIQGIDTTQGDVVGGPQVFQGRCVAITLAAAADYTNGTGLAISAAQAGLKTIAHGFGYVLSSAGAAKGLLGWWDPSLATPAFRLFATGSANQAALAEIASSSAALAANDVFVAFIFGIPL